MRGRPPPPSDVATWEAAWVISGRKVLTTSWHVLAPGSWAATDIQLNTLLGDLVLTALPDLLAVVGTDVTVSVCRLSTYGDSPMVVQYQPAPNVGAVGTTNTANSALVLTWRTGERLSSSLGHTFLPLSDTFVDDDHSRLKTISWSQAQAAAESFLNHVNEVTSPDGGLCVLGVVHRSAFGRALANARFAPVQRGDASYFVGTLARRIRSGESAPSSA